MDTINKVTTMCAESLLDVYFHVVQLDSGVVGSKRDMFLCEVKCSLRAPVCRDCPGSARWQNTHTRRFCFRGGSLDYSSVGLSCVSSFSGWPNAGGMHWPVLE